LHPNSGLWGASLNIFVKKLNIENTQTFSSYFKDTTSETSS